MPGSLYTLRCGGCAREHEVHTGTGIRGEYCQLVCSACGSFTSTWFEPGEAPAGACEGCGGSLEPWSGRVWHERRPGGEVGAERFEGPCPGCGTELTLGDAIVFGLWD